MPYNLDIPGWMPEAELRIIERLARTIPPGGAMLEIGSFCGRSTWCWSKSVDPSVEIVCIDIWDPDAHPYTPPSVDDEAAPVADDFGRTGGRPLGNWGTRANFEHYTRDCRNLIALQGESPYEFEDWPEDSFDLVFLDGVHHNPVFRDDVEHWFERVKPGGLLCGDDCAPTHPDVAATLGEFCAARGLDFTVERRIWTLRRPVVGSQG